jgi:glycosyltransferase involved in cell wall biosynthesis
MLLWSGELGGIETLTIDLARTLRTQGVDARVVFVCARAPRASRVDERDVPTVDVGLPRGRAVLRHPRRFARAVTAAGPDGVVLPEVDFLTPVLRAAGYRGRIVAVEHGTVLQGLSTPRMAVRLLAQRACDVEVAVSDSMLAALPRRLASRRRVRIRNGLDLDRYAPAPAPERAGGERWSVAFAGRLIAGKGADVLLRAAALLAAPLRPRVVIAGDGPERPGLRALATELGVEAEFPGWVKDMARYWRACDAAVVPSDEWRESFGLVAVEAMACGRPVIASAQPALLDIVADGRTGLVVAPGDLQALSAALARYGADPALRAEHGAAARRDVEARFDIRGTAEAYARLFE